VNKWEKEVAQSLLNDEKAVLEELTDQYEKALQDIQREIVMFENDIARLDLALADTGLTDEQKAILLSRKQAKVYQKQYQEALEGQLNNIMYNLCFEGYETINQYLTESYDNAFIGELYNLQKQGVPIIVPIDQNAAVRAILTNSKLSAGLYAKLGIDLMQMKTDITREVTRGIAKGMIYKDMARNLKNVSGVSLGKAKTIVRTEGHRIQEASRFDAQHRAKDIGADVVKQWDSALDSKTRDTHVKLNGQLREIDEPFEVDGKKAMYPGEFGKPEEDINCRCRSNTRARWALSSAQTKQLGKAEDMSLEQKQAIADKLKIPVKDLDKYSEQIVPINAKDYEDFKRQYKEYWHYEGSELQKEAEARIAGYETGKKSGKMAASANNDWSKATARPVSQKDKQEIIRYAKNRGITIGDIDSFDGDPKLLKSEIETVQKACKDYRVKSKITINSKVLDDDDFAITDGKTITFNSKALRLREITEANIATGGRFASATLEDIALHETGHIIEQENSVNAIEIAKKAYYNISGKHVSTKMIKTFLPSVASKYSAQMEHEIVSEVIVANKNSPNEFTKEFVSLLKGDK